MKREHISLWMEQAEPLRVQREPLETDLDIDIAIIGAGFTGLWTAYYLKQHKPDLRIALFEQKCVGYGASGRNGGWLLGEMAGQELLLSRLSSDERTAYYGLIKQIPDSVEQVLLREGIDCGYRKGGTLVCAARYPEQLRRLRSELAELHAEGFDESDYRWLDRAELAEQVGMANAYGAIYSPHCATVQPAQLVLGLAAAVERLGVTIYERSPVAQWQPGELSVSGHRVKAGFILPCVEGYGVDCPPLGRYQLAVQSLQIATEPLSEALWSELRMDRGQAVCEHSRLVTYCHRTRDDRLAFGARGGYRFGGTLRQNFELAAGEREHHRALMLSLFPQLDQVQITHGWGGNLGISRRFLPHMLCDRSRGIALAGGYGGEGVGASHLAGRTLADLVLGRDTPETRAPWVIRDSSIDQALRGWEPEPFRWLGYSTVMAAYSHEDRVLANPASADWRRRMASMLAERMSRLMTPTRPG